MLRLGVTEEDWEKAVALLNAEVAFSRRSEGHSGLGCV